MRQVLVLSLAVAAGAFAVACGDDDDDKNNGGEQGRDGGGGDGVDGGTGGKADGGGGKADGGGGGADGGNGGACDYTPGGDEEFGDCTEAEIKAYGECVDTACQDKYVECYGPGYKQGNFTGVCGDYMECTSKCECEDTACYEACQPSTECNTCMQGFSTCALSCFNELSCAFGDGGIPGGGKTCADLEACCASLTDADAKMECETTLMFASSSPVGDLACGSILPQYCP